MDEAIIHFSFRVIKRGDARVEHSSVLQ
ncbi:hypothetical protein RDI58_017812 [Solanum bulbocastanum]|uniref:Uncharacterized protein n=1 Tax=Solanum bulbocastanum TaxID=147425 RepID=A0AAN8TG49_SOLBU